MVVARDSGMSAHRDSVSDASADGMFDDGVMDDQYELVGVFNEDSDPEPGYEYEIFIVAARSEV